MKIGILTFHCAYNYGAQLQCYALQEYLTMLGVDVYVLNYRPSYLATKCPKLNFSYFKPTAPMRAIKRLSRVFPSLKRSYSAFKSFETKYLRLTEEISDSKALEELLSIGYDSVIVGSDQIWNTRFNGSDAIWFGLFRHSSSVKVISYAASAGDPQLSDFQSLRGFDAISVRENVLKEFLSIRQITSDISVVCDPTLLAPKEIWDKWKMPVLKKPYVLVYQGRRDDSVKRIAKDIAMKYNAEVVAVDNYLNSFSDGIIHMEPGPDEFVSLVNNATCVVTTSFHGAAMSIALCTPFYVIRLDDGEDVRAEEMLRRLDLIDRMVSRDFVPKCIELDFSDSLLKLDTERKNSEMFLNKNLNLWKSR